MQYPVYLDHNATTPCDQRVIEAMLPFFKTHFGNASSKNHPYGWIAEEAVENARSQVAKLIGAKTKEIIFTSGATEAINLSIKGTDALFANEARHYITCKTEHRAVLDCFLEVEKLGAAVTYLDVDEEGKIDLIAIENSIRPETKMIAFMWANNETGLIHPIEQIKAIAESHKLIFFTDAVQAVGKIPVSVKGVHLLSLSGHKIYGPKGIGALYIRHNHELPKPLPIIHGGGHEKQFRSGTLNVPGIVGMGKAAELALGEMPSQMNSLAEKRDAFEQQILNLPGTKRNGSVENRLPNTCNIAFEGVEGEELLRLLNLKVAVSSGSACSSILPKPSHVLTAMGITSDLGRASVRFSLGKETSWSDLEICLFHVKEVLEKLRQQ